MNALSLQDQFARANDPATLGWPPTLPIEIALKTAPLDQIREDYGYTVEEWERLRYDPLFVRDLTEAVELVKKDGMSFKLKAKLQAEELLKQSWQMIHADPDTVPSSVKADLIKSTMRWAGYDNKDVSAPQVPALAIQINL